MRITDEPVLLVSADPFLLTHFNCGLQNDYLVLGAANCEEAQALLERIAAFSAVIVDRDLQEGAALRLLAAAANRLPHCARLAVSYREPDAPVEEAINAGTVHRFVQLPCRVRSIREAIREIGSRNGSGRMQLPGKPELLAHSI